MASVGLPILLALILCTVCTGTSYLSSGLPPPPHMIPVCPAFNTSICPYVRLGPPQCHNDSQCTDSKKCCCNNCGLMCVTPEKVKAGRCPDIKPKCRAEPTYNCTSDRNCPGTKKCCNICGRTCWNPAPEPVGICPRNDGGQSNSLQCHSVNCSRDSDCKMEEKCCASGGGKSCVKPSTAPPPPPDLIHVCPAFNSSICLYARPGPPQCHNDSQCTDSKKCCCNNCGLMCVTPEKVRAGRCPDIKPKCRPEPTYNCTSDRNCPGTKKCCNICGRTCWDPAPEPVGFCPRNDGGQSKSLQCHSVNCSRDSDCKMGEKCCASGGGKSCVKPSTVKPGKCESPLKIQCIRASYTCESDGECSGEQKCCNICGRNCWNPKSVKPGKCPSPLKINCIWATYTCKSDNDCSEDKKCCGICGMNCWDPETEPAGNDNYQSNHNQCLDCIQDKASKKNHKCRKTRDGKKCVKST